MEKTRKRTIEVLTFVVLGLLIIPAVSKTVAAQPISFSTYATLPVCCAHGGLSYDPFGNRFIVQAGGVLWQVGPTGSLVTAFAQSCGLPSLDEINIAVASGLGGFSAGFFYVGQGATIFKIDPTGTSCTVFATLSGGAGSHTALSFDRSPTAPFGNQLISVQLNGQVSRISSTAIITPIASLGFSDNFEDLIVTPPVSQYPALPDRIVLTAEGGSVIAINTAGVATTIATGLGSPEALFLLPPTIPTVGVPSGMFAVQTDSFIYRAAPAEFLGLENDIVVGSEFSGVFYTLNPSAGFAVAAHASSPFVHFEERLVFIGETPPIKPIGIKVSKFFTDSSLNPLALDSNGNPKVDVVLTRGIVASTNPGQVLAWVNVTNTSGSRVQSLKLNETLPVDWKVDPAWVPAIGAIHVFFANTTSLLTNPEITQPSTITASSGNPQTVHLAIPSFNATAIGHPLMPGQSILLSVKLTYGLIHTSQSASSYPRNYTDTVVAVAWTQASFTGTESTGTSSAFFVADSKVVS